jgi:transcriptional regulator with XRE-family HTH domain
MKTIIALNGINRYIVFMKKVESLLLLPNEQAQSLLIGERIQRLRIARRIRQEEAAIRAGMSRPTARKIEQGDPGRTVGQVLRYLQAIAPGMSLLQLLEGNDPSLAALQASERRQRVRELSKSELERLDF